MSFEEFLSKPNDRTRTKYRMALKKVAVLELEKLSEKLRRQRFRNKRVLKSEMAVAHVKWSVVGKDTIQEIKEAIKITKNVDTFEKMLQGEYQFFSQGIYYFNGVKIEIDYKEIDKQLILEKIKELEEEKDQIRGGMSFKSRGITNENKQSIITQMYCFDEPIPYSMIFTHEDEEMMNDFRKPINARMKNSSKEEDYE